MSRSQDRGLKGQCRVRRLGRLGAMRVDWDGAVNAAQVGPGLFRMGRREALTEAGWSQARAAGVRSMVDLRSEAERGRREGDPDVASAATLGMSIVVAPTETDVPEYEARFGAYLSTPAHYAYYLRLFGTSVARAVIAVAEAPEAVVVHCSAGRDRTGLVVALGQRVAGVAIDDVVAGWREAAGGINAYHMEHIHPREPFLAGPEWDAFIAPRLAALRWFLVGLDASSLLQENGAAPRQLDAVAARFASVG